MARSRNIKPGFFTNEDLLECEPLARILFSGLWCWADREGRLEDRPKKFKIEILPGDSCDVEVLLQQLADKKMIVRYRVAGVSYIVIPKFKTHQNPHSKEAASSIPAPNENDEHQPRQVLPPTQDVIDPADSLPLIPDSSNSITDNTNLSRKALADLTMDYFDPWVTQQQVSGRVFIVDIAEELERFKDHFLTSGGKMANGNQIVDFPARFRTWIKDAETKKREAKSEKNGNRSGAIQAAGVNGRSSAVPVASKADRAAAAFGDIISKRNAQYAAQADPGLPDFAEQPHSHALPGVHDAEGLRGKPGGHG